MKFVFPSWRFWSCGLLLVGLTIVVATGCKPQDQIATYSTPKPESIETPIAEPNPAAMPPRMGSRPSAPSTGKSDVKFTKPDGWNETAGTGFSAAAFEVVDGDDQIKITVSPTGGNLLANMNRWRDQVGLPHFSNEEMDKAFQPREVNGLDAKFIELHSPDTAPQKSSILGVIVEDGDRTWFIKLSGATALANRERENFDAFAKSLQW